MAVEKKLDHHTDSKYKTEETVYRICLKFLPQLITSVTGNVNGTVL